MMANTQPLVDALLVTDPPRTIDAGTEVAIRAAITADLGVYANVDAIYAGFSAMLETVARNASL